MEKIGLLSLKIVFVLVFFLLFSGTVLTIFQKNKEYITQSDFYTHYPAAVLFKEGKGEDIYNLDKVDEYSRLYLEISVTLFTRSLPFIAVFYLPFTSFPLEVSYRLFGMFWLALIVLCSLFFYRHLNKDYKYGFVLLLPLVSFQLVRSVIIGQSSVILFFVSLFCFFFLDKKKYFLAGLMSGLFFVKIQYATLIPFLFLLSKERVSYIKGLALSFLTILAVSVFITGIDGLLAYPSFLLSTESYAFGSKFRNMFSFTSLLLDLFPNSINMINALFLNALFYSFLFFLFLKNFKKIDFKLSFVISFVFAVVSSAHVYNYDLVLLIIPTIVLIELALSLNKIYPKALLFLYSLILFVLINYTESIFSRSYQSAIVLTFLSLSALFSSRIKRFSLNYLKNNSLIKK